MRRARPFPLLCCTILAGLPVGCPSRPLDAPAPAPPMAAPTQVHLKDVARPSGIIHRWKALPRPLRNIDSFGFGCAFLDYNADGWQDLLLVDQPAARLFRNRGDGTFLEETEATGLGAIRGNWRGCAAGDVDGDGWPDLLLNGYRRLALLRNDRGARWEDVTARWGLEPGNRKHWGSSAGFMDLNADGKLDLVLLHYVEFGPHTRQFCELKPGLMGGCPPAFYLPEFPELWQNEGGRFAHVTACAGLETANGKALALAFSDFDEDGRPDFFIANDTTPADLFHNEGGMRFTNVGVASGVAYGQEAGKPIAAMCADWGDYDGDGRADLVVSANSDESYSLLRNAGRSCFDYASSRTGLSEPTLKPLGFGGKWIDVDNDGWPDIAFANGQVQDRGERAGSAYCLRQPMMLFHNRAGVSFDDLVPSLGGDLARPIVGRGTAVGDYDNDGRPDLLVVDIEGEPLLLHNETIGGGHWLSVELRGCSGNSFAYGAGVTARAGRRVWTGYVSPASSYLSSSDPRVHFGLGSVSVLESLTVRWPDGHPVTLRNVRADRFLQIREGEELQATALPAPRAPG